MELAKGRIQRFLWLVYRAIPTATRIPTGMLTAVMMVSVSSQFVPPECEEPEEPEDGPLGDDVWAGPLLVGAAEGAADEEAP